MNINDLDTPALVVDLDVMERNLQRMADYTKAHSLRLRPHTKTHKIPALGAKQLALGAVGLTVAKVSEAEVMLASGAEDLLIAYPIFGAEKMRRLVEVAKKVNVTVSVDSLETARPIAEAAKAAGIQIGVLAEVDAGLHRVGAQPEVFLDLLRGIAGLDGIELRGMAFYPGHIKNQDGAALSALSQLIQGLVAEASAAGFALPVVSGGSTPTEWHSHEVAGMNEVRPGTYIFNDRNTVLSGACGLEDCAVTILTTVVSTAVPGQFVIDGGSKTFSSDRAAAEGFGMFLDAPDALFEKMNEEHGYVKHAGHQRSVGERVRVLPNHVCVAVNLHERIYGVRGEAVEEVWTVDGRGKLQ
ncbi:MAG TPA: alanine racemase [Bryobacteraceae bacterium]|nr:alanine racemase [Bryobacteraceae bacterium]